MKDIHLTNGVFRLHLRNIGAAPDLYQNVIAFFTPFFYPAHTPESPHLTICFHPSRDFLEKDKQSCDQSIQIRKSSARRFNLYGKYHEPDGDRLVVWDEMRRTGYRIQRKEKHVDFYGNDESFIHLVESIRYYGLLVEQSEGAVILHSSAVCAKEADRNAVFAICGLKGAGKTTIMLHEVFRNNRLYFSGDKLLVTAENGKLMARGWPDYPHIGLGTLSLFPDFARRTGIDLDSEIKDRHDFRRKILIEPHQYYRYLPLSDTASGELAGIIVPDLKGENIGRGVPDPDDFGHDEFMQLVEFPHEFYSATWHGVWPDGFTPEKRIPEAFMASAKRIKWEYQTAGQLPISQRIGDAA